MKTSRRGLLKLSAQTLIGASLGGLILPESAEAGNKPARFSGDIPVLQLMTNSTSAQFVVLTDGHRPYSYRVVDSKGNRLPIERWDHAHRKGSIWEIDKLIVEGLHDGEVYRLQIITKYDGLMADERYFRNLPLESEKRARFALASCAYDAYSGPSKHMWDCVGKARPDMIFFVGDTSYAEMDNFFGMKDLWDRYVESRRRLYLYRQPILVPTFAIWDDHDFGKNNGDRHFKHKGTSLSLFQKFWASKEVPGYKKTFGVGFCLTGFGQKFCFMDNRSFRDTCYSSGYHWGRDPQDCLLEELESATTPAWILSGSQFFGCYKSEESFMLDHGKNFVDFCRKLSRIEAPVALGSGDVHFSEIMRIEPKILGYKTHEFTSSSIHSFTSPFKVRFQNSRRQAFTWRHNFLIIESQRIAGGLAIATESFGSKLESLFKHQTKIIR